MYEISYQYIKVNNYKKKNERTCNDKCPLSLSVLQNKITPLFHSFYNNRATRTKGGNSY